MPAHGFLRFGPGGRRWKKVVASSGSHAVSAIRLPLGNMSATSLSLVREIIFVVTGDLVIHLHRPNALTVSDIKNMLCVISSMISSILSKAASLYTLLKMPMGRRMKGELFGNRDLIRRSQRSTSESKVKTSLLTAWTILGLGCNSVTWIGHTTSLLEAHSLCRTKRAIRGHLLACNRMWSYSFYKSITWWQAGHCIQ